MDYQMDRNQFKEGLTMLSSAILGRTEEIKREGPAYVYTGMVHGKVPSIPLAEGERYFSVHTEEEFNKVWRRMRKQHILKNVKSLFPLVNYFRQFCETSAYSIVFIPCHSSKWREDYGSRRADGTVRKAHPMVVRNAIRLAIRVGLLAVYEQGSFRRCMERFGVCSKYLYSKQAEKWITAKFREFGITKADFHRVTRSATKARVRREMSDAELMEKVRIGCGLNLPNLSDETVYRALFRNYPMLRELGDGESGDVKACNDLAVKNGGAEFGKMAHLTSAIRICRGKEGRITAISFRPWSAAGVMKSEDRVAKLNGMAKRRVVQHDEKASIYKVSRLCNYGMWTPQTQDLYPAMAGTALSREERFAYKHGLAMRLYFAESEKSCMSHILRLGRDVEDVCSRVEGWHVVQEASRRMREVVGPSFGSEIFLHEAAIYIRALRKLLEKGEKAILVYDCFYLIDSRLNSFDVEMLVRACAEEYYNTWFRGRGAQEKVA